MYPEVAMNHPDWKLVFAGNGEIDRARSEGFPMAVLDAFSYGVPVITSLAGGIGDVAKDGENMLVFNAGDISKLVEHLECMISNTSLRETLAANSLQLNQTTFNIKTITQQLSDIYDLL